MINKNKNIDKIQDIVKENALTIWRNIFNLSKANQVLNYEFRENKNKQYEFSETLTIGNAYLDIYIDIIENFKQNNKDIMEFITILTKDGGTTDFINAVKLQIDIIFNKNIDHNLLATLLKLKGLS